MRCVISLSTLSAAGRPPVARVASHAQLEAAHGVGPHKIAAGAPSMADEDVQGLAAAFQTMGVPAIKARLVEAIATVCEEVESSHVINIAPWLLAVGKVRHILSSQADVTGEAFFIACASDSTRVHLASIVWDGFMDFILGIPVPFL